MLSDILYEFILQLRKVALIVLVILLVWLFMAGVVTRRIERLLLTQSVLSGPPSHSDQATSVDSSTVNIIFYSLSKIFRCKKMQMYKCRSQNLISPSTQMPLGQVDS